jgi:hypothetical protein
MVALKTLLSGLGFDFPVMNKNKQGRSTKGIAGVLDYLSYLEIYKSMSSNSRPIQD